MTLHIHRLEGCAPTPLAHYLKALAILRLVSEQRDPDARGWWKEDAFYLATSFTREELVRFFLEEYEPTPILSPWNAGSGFYFREGKAKEKDEASGQLKKTGLRDQPTAATRAIDALVATDSPRLRRYRECACVARSVVLGLGLFEAPGEDEKASLIATLRSRLPDVGTRWLDAAVTSVGDAFECAPLVGSGGNDGNEDFSKKFLERVLELVSPVKGSGPSLLEACLFGGAVRGAHDIAAGQFLPGGNGGTNAGTGFTGDPTANPWDYVLAAEGSIVFSGAAARRLDAATGGAAFPFAVRVDAAGYPSAADSDRDGSRFEVWLPLWSQPASLSSVCSLLAEGRARVDRADAQRSTDVARALASLGTSRGIKAFERTAFFTRNGNMHFSAPVGRWDVRSQPHEDLLDDIQPWLRSFRAFARDRLAPKAVTLAARAVDEAVLAVCRAGEQPGRWQALLVALGRAEAALLRSPSKVGDPKRRLSPLPSLRAVWISAINDGSTELRLAIALASQDVALRQQGKTVFASVRAHWMPLDRARGPRRSNAQRLSARFATDSSGLGHDPDVVCVTDNLERDCIAMVRRRVQIAPALEARGLGLLAARGAEASLADVMAFVAEEVDDARVLALARPLMALEWWDTERQSLGAGAPPTNSIDAAYAIVRVAHLSETLELGSGERVSIALDPAPIARLAAGDLSAAAAICLQRFRASGLSPKVRAVVGTTRYARRLAASLAFPIRPGDARRCAELVTKPHQLEESVHAR